MQEYGVLIGIKDGAYQHFHGSEHIGLYAKTGAGKTSSMVITNCFTWPGSLVVLDIKGEAFRATAGWRADVLGQDVYLFDPSADDGRTHCWNPLQPIKRGHIDQFDQISRQAHMLFPESLTGSTSNADAFWTPSARGAFSAVAALLAETNDYEFTMAEVLRCFARGDSLEYLTGMIERRRGGYSQLAVDGVSDYTNGGIEQVGGIRKMTSTRLSPWFNPRIAAATSLSDIDLQQLRRRPMTVYVTVSPANIARMRPILALFFDALVNLNTDKTPEEDPTIRHQALIILDEFARLGRMDTLAEAAQYVRGYGLRMVYIVQNKAQIRAKYGNDSAEDIFDNTGLEIVFGTNDHSLTKELSERLGNDTINVVTENRPKWWSWMQPSQQREAEHPHLRALMLPQEIARLHPRKMIALRQGMLPVEMERVVWFEDPYLRSLVQPPPTIPQLQVSIRMDDGQTRIGARLPEITQADVPMLEDENA
jgi:type IV secretion system protein VirD4